MEKVLGNMDFTRERTFKGLILRHNKWDLLDIIYNAPPYIVCQYPLVDTLACVYVTFL